MIRTLNIVLQFRTYIRLNYRLNELENTKRVVHDSQSVSFNWFIVSDNVLFLSVWPIRHCFDRF